MRCSNCGKDVPFNGNVCPYCHVDKSKDQAVHTFGVVGGFLGAIVGWFIGPLFGGSNFFWALGGMVVGTGSAMIWMSAEFAKKKTTPIAPTVQRVEVVPPQVPVQAADDKTCPFCAETIKRAAVVCRYCNRDLPAATTDGPVQRAAVPTPPKPSLPAPTRDYASPELLQKLRSSGVNLSPENGDR